MALAEKLIIKIARSRKLAYRREKRLTTKQRIVITSSPLAMTYKCFALTLRSILKCSMRKALRMAEHHYNDYLRWTGRNFYLVRQEDNGPYLEKEFIFRGFVPRDSYKKRPGFNYIESNQPINGTFYIYPKKLVVGCTVKHWSRYPNAYNFHKEVGISGYTRVDWNYSLWCFELYECKR